MSTTRVLVNADHVFLGGLSIKVTFLLAARFEVVEGGMCWLA